MNRDFKGVWIPKEIYLDERLDANEKILFAEIGSLYDDGKGGCFASNEYLSKFLKVSDRQLQRYIANLKKIGLISLGAFNGRERVLVCLLRYDIGVGGDMDVTSGVTCRTPPFHIVYKKEDKDPPSSLLKEKSAKYLPVAEYLRDKIKASGTDGLLKESHIVEWCNHIRLMVEQDKRTVDKIQAKIDAVFKDSFWSKQIRSTKTLREKWNEGKLDRLQQTDANGFKINDDDDPKPKEPRSAFEAYKFKNYGENTTMDDGTICQNYLSRKWEEAYGNKDFWKYNFPDSTGTPTLIVMWEVVHLAADKKTAFNTLVADYSLVRTDDEQW